MPLQNSFFRPHSRTQPRSAVALILLCLSQVPAQAAPNEPADLSLEDLLKVEVTTASRKTQQLNDTAAAVFVISRDDIQRAGAASIPELLRLAPGVSVGRIAANRYAVSVRGFNGRFANKLLVLMDGRSIYSPLFSGVLWEFEDTMMEDVERIEVIRGPGGALWGANAVNAVINIITRKSRDTTGAVAVVGASTTEPGFMAARYGGTLANGHYRVWAQTHSQDASVDAKGGDAHDSARTTRAGFRADWARPSGNRVTLSGAGFNTVAGDVWSIASLVSPTGARRTPVSETGQGGHLLARYEWALSSNAEAALQTYLHVSRLKVSDVLREERTTYDLDFQYRTIGTSHDVLWGLGYRHSPDKVTSNGTYELQPGSRVFAIASAFIQDEWTLVPDKFRVIGGFRVEHNNFTGIEPQPNLRAIWTPSLSQSLWGAASRAIRTPSRGEIDAALDVSVTPPSPPVPAILVRRLPNSPRDDSAEKVDTVELGYRLKLSSALSVDVAAYRSQYDSLQVARLGQRQIILARPAPYVLQPSYATADATATSQGFELSADWQISPGWRVQPNYTFTKVVGKAKIADPLTLSLAGALGNDDPRHQFAVRSMMTFDKRHQLDFFLRYVGKLKGPAAGGGEIPAYTELDTRFLWQIEKGFDVAIGGKNLLNARHAEFSPDLLPSEAVQIARSFYINAKLKY